MGKGATRWRYLPRGYCGDRYRELAVLSCKNHMRCNHKVANENESLHMKLSKVRITGFQSYSDSGDIEFADGINLIVGQNNAGKSSLLRALRSELPNDRHRSDEHWDNSLLPLPSVTLTLRHLWSGISFDAPSPGKYCDTDCARPES